MASTEEFSRIPVRLPRFAIINGCYGLVTDWSTAIPIRPHWRIWWNPEPGAAIRHGATEYPLLSDRLLLVPPYVSILHHLEKPTHSLALHVDVDTPVPSPSEEVFYPRLPAGVIERFQKIPETYPEGVIFSGGESNDPNLSWFLGEIVCRSFQYLPLDLWKVSRKDSRIEDALDTLREKRIEGCSNEELARQACLSTNAFIRLFKQEVGVPPQVCLQNMRLEHAARLLLYSEHSVEQVAEECGFCDRNYMSKLFKRRFLVGPAMYRRQGG